MLTDKGFQTPKTRSAVVGVKRRESSPVSGVPCLNKVERLAAAHFAHDDAVGTHAESRFQEVGHAAFGSGLVTDFVQRRGIEFGGVFNDDLPCVRFHDGDFVQDGVAERGFPRSRAADDKDVLPACDCGTEVFTLPDSHDAGIDILPQGEHADGASADRERGMRHHRRYLPGEAGVVQRQDTFQPRVFPRDGRLEIACNLPDEFVSFGFPHIADMRHPFAELFPPHLPVRIQHQFDGAGVEESVERDGGKPLGDAKQLLNLRIRDVFQEIDTFSEDGFAPLPALDFDIRFIRDCIRINSIVNKQLLLWGNNRAGYVEPVRFVVSVH